MKVGRTWCSAAVKVCLGFMIQAKEKSIDSTGIMGVQCRFLAEIIHHSSSSSYYLTDLEVRPRKFRIVKVEGWPTGMISAPKVALVS